MQAQVVGELGVEAKRRYASLPDCDCVPVVLGDHLDRACGFDQRRADEDPGK